MNEFSFVQFLAAIGFFLLGLRETQRGLHKFSGDRIRSLIKAFTRKRLRAFFLGIFLAILIQSSTGVVFLLIGFSGLGLISLRRGIPVVLGADLGTTFLVFLLASLVRFDLQEVSFFILIIAFMIYFFFRTGRKRHIARSCLGLAFVFFGLSMISQSSIPVRESALVRELITALADQTLVAIFFGILFAALLQSSAALLGILLSFVSYGVMDVGEAIPFVLGANVGSGLSPFLMSLRASVPGRRLGLFHLLSKGFGALLFLPLIPYLSMGAQFFTDIHSFQLALIHFAFNLFLAFVFLPIVPLVVEFMPFVVPDSSKEQAFESKYLDENDLKDPRLAFSNVFREFLRMAEITQEMFAGVLDAFHSGGEAQERKIGRLDDRVDKLYRESKLYLSRIDQSEFSEEDHERLLELLMLARDLESVGDIISKDLVVLARKMRSKGVPFTEEGWQELRGYHGKVMENFQLAIASIASGDAELGRKVINRKKKMAMIEQDLGQAHFLRLHQGVQESILTSSVHLDVLANLRRINSAVSKLTYPTIDRNEPTSRKTHQEI